MSVSQEEYGDIPGVRTIVIGGGIASTTVGRELKLVVFGRGDPSTGDADANDPTQITTRVGVDREFGADTQLADGMRHALENKGNIDYMYGVMPEETDVVAETISGGSNTLENAPIVEDTSLISITNTNTGNPVTPEFRYEDPPETPSTADTAFINPLTGAVEGDTTDDLELDYTHLDWQGALDAADQVLNHNEVGVYAPLTDSHAVADMLSDKLSGTDADDENNGLRGERKLAAGVVGAQPNATSDEGLPVINPQEYSDSIDDPAVFMAGNTRRTNYPERTILGGVAGVFAGNQLTNPIYGDSIRGYDRLTQSLSNSEVEALSNQQVIPVQDDYRDGGGGITLEGHHSTSTATDWNRTYQNRRLVDLIVLAQREIGEAARTNLMRDQQLGEIEAQIRNVFDRFARQGLIKGNPDDQPAGGADGAASGNAEQEQAYFVEASRSDNETVAVASGFSPISVITGVEETIQVADSLNDLTTPTTEGDS